VAKDPLKVRGAEFFSRINGEGVTKYIGVHSSMKGAEPGGSYVTFDLADRQI